MKKHLFLLLILPSTLLVAQQENLKPFLIDENTDPTRWLYIAPKETPGVWGQEYLFESWPIAEIEFRDHTVKSDLYINYNLETQILEVYTDEGIKVVPDGLVLFFHFEDEVRRRTFVHHSRYTPDYSQMEIVTGYFELLYQGKDAILLDRHYLVKRDPTYNERLGIGDNNIRYFQEEDPWMLSDNHCVELPSSGRKREKRLASVLQDLELRKIVKANDLNLKVNNDLVTLMELVE